MSVLEADSEIELTVPPFTTFENDETDFGAYARAGVAYPIGESFPVGIDLRGLFLTGEDFDYLQAAVTAGWTL